MLVVVVVVTLDGGFLPPQVASFRYNEGAKFAALCNRRYSFWGEGMGGEGGEVNGGEEGRGKGG